MADMTAILSIGAFTAAVGLVIGWLLRGARAAAEKAAMNASWRDQIAAQKTEHDRLAGQNTSLMEQISEHRGAQQEADSRAKSLSESLQAAFAERDDLKRQLENPGDDDGGVPSDRRQKRGRDKDDKIFRLSRELESWRNRLPPLLEKYRERDLEAQQLEVELEAAMGRIADLERRPAAGSTRIEPFDDQSMAARVDASNERFPSEGESDVDDVQYGHSVDDSVDDREDDNFEHSATAQTLAEIPTTASVDEAIDAADEDPKIDQTASGEVDIPADTYLTTEVDVDFDLGGGETLAERLDRPDTETNEIFAASSAATIDEALDDSFEKALDQPLDDLLDAAEAPENSAGDTVRGPVFAGNGTTTVIDELLDSGDATALDWAISTSGRMTADGADEEADDLQAIKGVGPAIEKTLNRLGIYRYGQIADLSEAEIDRVAGELRGFRTRIYREDWIGQARQLESAKSGVDA